MSPKALMILGGFGGLLLLAASLITPFTSGTVAVFMFGAIFGKGYGIWEERAGRRALEESRHDKD